MFAAYSKEALKPVVTEEEIKFSEEALSSFTSFKNVLLPQDLPNLSNSSSNTNEDTSSNEEEDKLRETRRKSKKKHKKHKKHKRRKYEHEQKEKEEVKAISESNLFEIDTNRTPEYLTVDKIYRPCAPKCLKINYKILVDKNLHKIKRKIKFKRYFVVVNQEKLESQNAQSGENFSGFKHEEDLKEMTANFNKKLQENPSNVDLWIDYVNFQDTVFKFEKTYRKGSIAKGLRVTAERKLSILDKALIHNPDCEKLLRERLNIAVSVYPSDELQTQLEKLVEKDQGNIILWQGFIESKQCSMSHCSTPKVLSLYTKCLSVLHKLRRSAKIEKSILEEYILRMLYQCGLFLRQAGLFEQLWTLLRMYLELNLSQKDFNVNVNYNEKQLQDLEDVILNSQLPIHELWLRIEKLRESVHWLPFNGEENCEDPQRMVFSEDVSELIHPITMPGNTFKLVITILSLLKVPLLPCRHTTMSEFGLDYVPWALDSVETLLATFSSLYPLNIGLNDLLKYTQKLAVGPQYLKTLPCQEEYLEFVLKIMQNSFEALQDQEEKAAIVIWWFRFLRLLITLEEETSFKMLNEKLKKKIKGEIKATLKKEEFRTCPLFYCEYSRFELATGKVESALKILQTTIDCNYKDKNLTTLINLNQEEEKTNYCHVFRTLIEIELSKSNDEKLILNHLTRFMTGNTNFEYKEVALKFKHWQGIFIQKFVKEKPKIVEHFIPNYFIDFVILQGWFIYYTEGVIKAGIYLENLISCLDDELNLPFELWKETFFEFYLTILLKHSMENPGSGVFKILDDVLYRAIENYPNNLYILSILLKMHTINRSLSQKWWKTKSMILKTGRALPVLFLVLILNQHINEVDNLQMDTITGEKTTITTTNLKNRMLALFRQITSGELCTKRCGLIWRLYLQFLHTYFSPKTLRDAYYVAVEELPWLKALYIDAAIYIPAELCQIQDLLLEKELRIHVTPEELDILRS